MTIGERAVALLAHVGEDFAGAVQFVRPEEVDRVLGASSAADAATSIEWLSTNDVANLLTSLRRNPAAGRSSSQQGQFSLAGAQPKTTLYREGGRWGIPKGRVPSTHILKPPVLDLEDRAYNEHFCLHLARELGSSGCRRQRQPSNCSTVRLFDCSTVRLFDCSTVRLFDCSTTKLQSGSIEPTGGLQ